MHQIIIDFGTLKFLGLEIPLRVFGYGLMLVFGFLSGIALARWRARRVGENPDIVNQCAIMALVGGILGARILYICRYWQNDFLDAGGNFRIVEFFNITSGGLVYFGGLLGGAITVMSYLLIKKLPVRRYIDIIVPSLMIGLAFGRVGCTLNGCCWGGPCEDQWALGIKFPMISKPLLKAGGDPNNPYSPGQGLSPTYSHQYWRGEVSPDPRLLNKFVRVQVEDDVVYGDGEKSETKRHTILPVDQLHRQLSTDQLETTLASRANARKAFEIAVGAGLSMSKQQWDKALADDNLKILRGSEAWDEAIQFDHSKDGELNFEEMWFYLQDRKQMLTALFDADNDNQLQPAEQDKANEYLQADTFGILANQWSNPRKPAQLLGIINGLLLTGLLLAFYRHRRREGLLLPLMLITYPITRFLLESIRHENAMNIFRGQWTHNQISSAVMVIAGLILWRIILHMPPSAGPTLAERESLTIKAK